jgi:hypothetical protein
MNGFLKPVNRLLANPVRFAGGALVLDAGYAPRLDVDAVSRCAMASASFH